MRRNLTLFYLCNGLHYFYLVHAISTLFYQSIGINYTKLGILWIAMAVMQIICEVPFGIICDKIGRKKTIMLGFFIHSLVLFTIGQSSSFWGVFVGCLLWGVSAAALSGAMDAFLYDTLAEHDKADNYIKHRSNLVFVISGCTMVASILGTFMYSKNPASPWMGFAGTNFLAFILFAFTNDPIHKDKETTDAGSTNSHMDHIKTAFNYIKSHKDVTWLIIFFCMTICMTYSMALVRQPLLIERTFDVIHLGFIFASIEALSSGLGLLTPKIEKKLGEAKSLFLIIFGFSLGFISLSLVENKWAVIPLVVLYASFKFQSIITSTYLNHRIESHNRATVISLQSLICSFFQIALISSSGLIMDLYSVNTFLQVAGVFVGTVVFAWWLLRKRFSIE